MECYGASCYTLHSDVVLKHDKAQEYCKTIGGDLVTIETADNQQYLKNMISDKIIGKVTYNNSTL